ncbi:MAG: 6-phosphofructokinase [Candidatus Ozemobacter sibiricus]|jgi:6-phosphofructokinase 1|uniref:6-phosphofructokinase n=1 Tax=Candidatus Ozemobacter sibiricus TaxID=2268124 RepID=A0A367ZN30_9BACT|nr:MAG: 6-phosphofructokinase [Candidatus Ozemobacter sibiricus]
MIYADVLAHPEQFDFSIASLGPCTIDSPVKGRDFVEDDDQITFASQVKNILRLQQSGQPFPAFQKAGPRARIFHDPAWSHAALLTCGGLCPGLNNVIKGVVNVLWHEYGVRTIYGVKYGYQGLVARYGHAPLHLTPELVDEIHEEGGTILASSRGNQKPEEMVDTLERMNINLLFCIGGDGTLRGARDIAEEAARRQRKISVIGIPKTIDNDLGFIEKSFGFETAVHTAFDIITTAHNEAEGAYNGVGIVKLMGRDSGFIAAAASLANTVVDFCLVPEVEFTMDGEHGLLAALGRKLDRFHHAVIVAAEGAGQHLFNSTEIKRDASGNILKNDIGLFLKDEINAWGKKRGIEVNTKYLDPSYHIRSVAAISSDAIFCYLLAENAVHAAMAGKTNMVIGNWNNYFTHVPIALATRQRRKIDLDGALWKGVLSATQQDEWFAGVPKGK